MYKRCVCVFFFFNFNVNIFNLVSILYTHSYTYTREETLAVFTRVAGNGVYLLCKWNGRTTGGGGGGGQRSQIKWLCDDILLCERGKRWYNKRILASRLAYIESRFFFLFLFFPYEDRRNFSIPLLYPSVLRARKILFPHSRFIVFYRNTFNDLCDTVLTVKRGEQKSTRFK